MRERTRVLAAASVALLSAVLVWFNYSALLPLVVEEWGLTGVEAGAVFAAFQAGYVVGVLPAGRLADRFSARWVVAAGTAGTGVASLGFAGLASGVSSAVALRALAGLCMAGVYVPGMGLLAEWYPPERRGTAIGVYAGAFSLSTGLSFLLSSAVASALDWRTAIAATSVLAVVAGPALLLTTRDHPGERTARTEFDLSALTDLAYRRAVVVYAGHTWELFGARNWLAAFLVAAPAVAAPDDPTVTAGLVAGAALSLGGVGNLLGGWASDSLGRLPTIGGALGISTAGSLVLGLLVDLPLSVLVAAVIVYGLALVADSSPVSTAVTELAPDDHIGVALAVQTLVGFAASAVSPVVFGVALDWGGWRIAFPTLAVGGLVALAAAWTLSRRPEAFDEK
jgi:MFS family permease